MKRIEESRLINSVALIQLAFKAKRVYISSTVYAVIRRCVETWYNAQTLALLYMNTKI